jgi:hypothetical protein
MTNKILYKNNIRTYSSASYKNSSTSSDKFLINSSPYKLYFKDNKSVLVLDINQDFKKVIKKLANAYYTFEIYPYIFDTIKNELYVSKGNNKNIELASVYGYKKLLEIVVTIDRLYKNYSDKTTFFTDSK